MKGSSLEEIYADLKLNLHAARLKEISIEVIRHYRERNAPALSRYAALLGIETAEDGVSRLFSRVIQRCHPDRLEFLMKEVDRCYGAGALDELRSIRSAFLGELPVIAGAAFEPPEAEDYRFDEGDFGYEENDRFGDAPFEEFDDDGFIHETEVERRGDVIGAIHDLFVGNLDITLGIDDLNNLEGELDLSDLGLESLDGIEHCVNISALNLSENRLEKVRQLAALERLESLFLAGNRIESIDALGALSELRELDISFNRVEDVTVLLSMKKLAYVNLMENPVKTTGVVRSLREKGVIVII